MPADPLGRYHPPREQAGKLHFRVFVASRTDLGDFRRLVSTAVRRLNQHRYLGDHVVLDSAEFDDPDRPVGLAANPGQQAEIEAEIGAPGMAEIVVGLIEYSVGPYTRHEILQALDGGPATRPRLIVACPRFAPPVAITATAAERAAQAEAWAGVLALYERILAHGGHAALYTRREEAVAAIATDIESYLERQVRARGRLGAPAAAVEARPAPRLDPMGKLYPGLAALRREDAHLYFGREDKRAAFVDLLCDPAQGRVVCIQGPSGAGKSSLVMAGIIPHLKPSPDAWHAIVMRPNQGGARDPFRGLVAGINDTLTLSGSGDLLHPERHARALAKEPARLAGLLDERLGADAGRRILLYVDQAEELLLDCETAAVDRFVECLHDLVEGGVVSLVATLRADVQDAVCRHARLSDLLAGRIHPLGPPTGTERIRAMIREPAAAAGLEFEDALLDDLVRQSLDEPNCLPLLAASLEDVHDGWKQRRRADPGYQPVLALADFAGFNDVIAKRARRALEACDDLSDALEQLLERLVDFDWTGRPRRRAARLAEFEDDPDLKALAEALIGERLLVAEPGARVQLIHERLMEAWPDLADWLAAHREPVEDLRYLEQRALRWSRRSRQPGGDEAELLALDHVAAAEAALERHGWRLNAGGRESLAAYLARSRSVREKQEFAAAIGRGDIDEVLKFLRTGVRLTGPDIARVKHPSCYYAMRPEDIPVEDDTRRPAGGALGGFAQASSRTEDLIEAYFDTTNAQVLVESGFAPVHFAALANQTGVLRRLAALGVPPDFTTVRGTTPAAVAATGGARDALAVLHGRGADLCAGNQDGYTPLHWACHYGHADVAAYLLDQGPPQVVDAVTSEGWSPLMLAVHPGHAAIVDLLLSRVPGPDLDRITDDGWTALMLAAAEGHHAILVRLLAHHPPPDVAATTSDCWNVLMLAAGNGHDAVVCALLSARPDLDIDAPGPDGRTALVLACASGREGVVRRLLAHQPPPDVDVADKDGSTAMTLAAETGQDRIVRALLGHTRPPRLDATRKDGTTALMMAARGGHEAVIGALLGAPGLTLDQARADDGGTALLDAMVFRQAGCVRLLRRAGASIPARFPARGHADLLAAAVDLADPGLIAEVLTLGGDPAFIDEAFGSAVSRAARDPGTDPAVLAALTRGNPDRYAHNLDAATAAELALRHYRDPHS